MENNAYQKLIDYIEFLKVENIKDLPGLWVHKVDDNWTIKSNGHKHVVERLNPFCFLIEYNGWPAATFDAFGKGMWNVAEPCSQEKFIEVINEKMAGDEST